MLTYNQFSIHKKPAVKKQQNPLAEELSKLTNSEIETLMKDVTKDEIDSAISRHHKTQNFHRLIPKSINKPRTNKVVDPPKPKQQNKPQSKAKNSIWDPPSVQKTTQPVSRQKNDFWGQPVKTFDYQKKPAGIDFTKDLKRSVNNTGVSNKKRNPDICKLYLKFRFLLM